MKQTILNKLQTTEEMHDVTILYAVESGSRAWGFASVDSDYDVRFIYHHPVQKYLSLASPEDVIQLPIHEDLDFHGWDLYKAGQLLLRSNPSLIEWLFSPIVYIEQGEIAKKMRDWALNQVSLKRLGYHYLSMARGNYKNFMMNQQEVSAKKYMYLLRALFCLHWLDQHQSVPPVSVWQLLSNISLASWCIERFHDLVEKKMVQESLLVPADEQFHSWIMNEIDQFEEKIASFPDHKTQVSQIDEMILSQLGFVYNR
ncbi:nucleotidyltransferase domain-containing protein [Hazenella coriacea]|uniref:Nucleotidyltransferase n=1 Tax=Hazenella coriacea TaxID=1179467 RepID=A0A4R3L5F8_9BACL|nr:nucleotidyltransferase domain-containing protein [Hazenella coriacea]TCS94923.1 hypothetical protein EDD58_103348 [Hazenella coriacea]